MWHPKISSNAYQRSLDVQKCMSSTLRGWKLESSWIVTYLVTHLLASWCVCVFIWAPKKSLGMLYVLSFMLPSNTCLTQQSIQNVK